MIYPCAVNISSISSGLSEHEILLLQVLVPYNSQNQGNICHDREMYMQLVDDKFYETQSVIYYSQPIVVIIRNQLSGALAHFSSFSISTCTHNNNTLLLQTSLRLRE